jgi:hypothetical protein
MNQHVCHRDLLIPNILTKGLSTDPNLYALQSSKKCKPQPTTPSRFAYVEAIVGMIS